MIRKVKYEKTPLSATYSVKNLYSLHYFKYGRDFWCEREQHDFWEMVYIDSGEAFLIADERRIPLKKGEAYFHRPNEVHTVCTESDFANSVIVSFDCDVDPEELAGRVLTLGSFEKQILQKLIAEGRLSFSGRLDDIYQTRIERREDAPPCGDQIIKSSLELLIALLLRRDGEKSSVPSSAKSGLAEEVERYLRENVTAKLDLDNVSAQFAFSKSYIKRVFRESYNESVMKYFAKLKIEESKKLISRCEESVTEIANKLNFSSVQYFCRLFKTAVHMTPSEYAVSIQADNIL